MGLMETKTGCLEFLVEGAYIPAYGQKKAIRLGLPGTSQSVKKLNI